MSTDSKGSPQSIRDEGDVIMALCFGKDLDIALPIDNFLLNLDGKGVLADTLENKILLRSAVFTAWQHAWRGPQRAGKIQLARKKVPEEINAIITRTEKILALYAEIASSFDGERYGPAQNYIEKNLHRYFPANKRKAESLVMEWRFRFAEFISFEKVLHDFKKTLQIGIGLIEKPKRGASKQSTYFFVTALAVEWYKITSTPPKRVFDPIEEKETGDFYNLCEAAAQTVKGAMPFGSIDAAVRAVCDEWRVQASREDLRDLWWEFEPRGPIKIPKLPKIR